MKRFINYFAFTLITIITFVICLNIKFVSAGEEYPFNGIINADALVVYSDLKDENEITQLAYGTRVTVVGANEKGNRYQIKFDGGTYGYVSSNFVINVDANTLTTDYEGVESYRTYCDSLKATGFVESYCPYLYYLHVKHPNWIFTPNVVDVTLEEASVREIEKVSLQTNNSNYWVYKDGEPFVNEYSSSGNYYYIKEEVISSFMDPRNSLFESTIFQFLNLEKNLDAINDVALLKISGENGNLKSFHNEFMSAANSVGINALHLMARSRQEGANTFGYSPTTGTFTTTRGLFNPDGRTLDGFYNFYNIGAYVEQSKGYTSSIQRGLAYGAGYLSDTGCYSVDENGVSFYDITKCEPLTYQRPWNTPEKAVVGGGEWIGSRYVKKGQNTNYFQKFNVSNYAASAMFTNQYMTNAYAPTAESLTLQSAYNAGGLLETNFEFVIPVYKDMQDIPYQAVDKSNDSKLNSIMIDGNLIAGFDKDVVEYTINALTANEYIDVTATVSNGGATLEGVGKYDFVDGVATVLLKVIAEDGVSTTEYSIVVTKVVPEVNITINDIVSNMGVKVDENYMYGISPGMVVNTLVNNVVTNKGTASVIDVNGVEKTSGNLATGDKIIIKGTTEEKSYIIAVRGDTNGDGKVSINDFVMIQSHILEKYILVNEKFIAGDVNYDDKISINDFVMIQSHILEKIIL